MGVSRVGTDRVTIAGDKANANHTADFGTGVLRANGLVAGLYGGLTIAEAGLNFLLSQIR
jgi:hypothetical protein